jgi:hypothetical protein
MKVMAAILAVGALGAGLGLAGCGAGSAAPAVTPSSSGASPPAASSPAATSPAPTATRTVIKTVPAAAPTTSPAAGTPASSAPAAPVPSSAAPSSGVAPAQAPPGGSNVTDPLAVVFAYYGDIESGNYAQAYALIGNGATTGQSYSEFAAGFTCTGAQDVSENWESGDQVNFDLAATDSCTGGTDYYTGTDTVENGTIVAAHITKTG